MVTLFVVPYTSTEKIYTYWALKTHFKIIADKPFVRGDVLELIRIQGNIIYTKVGKPDPTLTLVGSFITLPPIDPNSKFILKDNSAEVLIRLEITDKDNLNKVCVLFVIINPDDTLRFSINDKEDILVNYMLGE